MMSRGQKRRLSENEGSSDSDSTWESQRQFVLSVSFDKYVLEQQLRDPCLRRSVLIVNTLRHITLQAQEEPSADGENAQPPGSPSSTVTASIFTAAKHHSAVTVDGHSGLASFPMVSLNHWPNSPARMSHSSESNVLVDDDEDWGSMSTDADSALSAAISSILNALDSTVEGIPQAAPRTPLRSLENLSGPYEGGVASVNQGLRGHGISREQQEESSMEVMRSSYLGDVTMEDLFQDIDSFLMEMNMGGSGHRSTEDGYPPADDLFLWLPPFSSHTLTPQSQKAQPALINQLA